MDANRINISKIETFFNGLLYKKVSDNVFFTNAPESIDKKWKDFIVVDCNGVADWNAYGRGTVRLFVYVPPMGTTGRKNVTHFSEIEKKLNLLVDKDNDPVYRIQRRETYSDYDEDMHMFVNIIEISLVVLT